MAYSASEITRIFDLLNLAQPDATRLQGLMNDSRSISQIRDALIWSIANSQGISFEEAVQGVLRQHFEDRGLTVATSGETETDRLARIYNEIFVTQTRTLGDVVGTLDTFGQPTPPTSPGPAPPTAPDAPNQPDPDPGAVPAPEPIDWRARVRVLYPYLPEDLVGVFADAWAATGDLNLALAEMRSGEGKQIYDTFFPGNRRSDGSLRHTEAEYFSIKEAYRTLYREFGLNPDLFEDKFTVLIEMDQSPDEHAARLGAAYEQVINNIPQMREIYARYGNIAMTDQAIFASIIDPTIGEAIVSRRISVAQVGAEGLARGFDVEEPFAARLASAGIDQARAREFFTDAEGRLPTLDELARRFHDPDADFDLDEFAEAAVFGDAGQRRRIRRLLAAESSLHSEQFGAVGMSDEFAITGLSAR